MLSRTCERRVERLWLHRVAANIAHSLSLAVDTWPRGSVRDGGRADVHRSERDDAVPADEGNVLLRFQRNQSKSRAVEPAPRVVACVAQWTAHVSTEVTTEAARPTRHVAFAIFALFQRRETRSMSRGAAWRLLRPLSRLVDRAARRRGAALGSTARMERAATPAFTSASACAEGRTRRPAAIDGAHSSRGLAGSHDGRKARPARLPRPASTRGPHRVSRHPQARLGWILGRERRRRRRGLPRPADAQRLHVPGSPAATSAALLPLGVVLTHVSADFDTLSSAVFGEAANHRLGANCTFVVLPRGASPGVAHYVQLHKNKFIREKKRVSRGQAGAGWAWPTRSGATGWRTARPG